MRTIKQSSTFKSDLKREAKGRYRVALAKVFVDIVATLAKSEPLAKKHRDHALTGDWKDHRDGHVKPGVVLIYLKPDDTVLQLVKSRLYAKPRSGCWVLTRASAYLAPRR